MTLLYPSRTEARLIIFVLGPLALAASGLVFTALSGHQTVLDVSDAIRNVFNSTLLLIFTLALFIWGFLVNRRRAWRLDGGTAVFGSAALFLAVVSTTFNFVAVVEDGIDWLQHLLFAAVLWQTWLGWWWWVGSGMGIGEVEDLMEKSERKKRKAVKQAKRRTAGSGGLGGQSRNRASSIVSEGASAMLGFSTSVAGILRKNSMTLHRRHISRSSVTQDNDPEDGCSEAIEMDRIVRSQPPASPQRPQRPRAQQGARVEFSTPTETTPPGSRNPNTSNSETSSTSATPSLHRPSSVGQLISWPTTWLLVSLRRLRHAHEDAARKQATQRAELRQQVLRNHARRDDAPAPAGASMANHAARVEEAVISSEGDGIGWGLGSFGIKEHRESTARLQEARTRLNEDRLLPVKPEDTEETGPIAGPSNTTQDPADGGEEGEGKQPEEEWEDVDAVTQSSEMEDTPEHRTRRRRRSLERNNVVVARQEDRPIERTRGRGRGTGWSWWGPLRDWRLSDRSVF